MTDRRPKQDAEIARLREALAVFADERNWDVRFKGDLYVWEGAENTEEYNPIAFAREKLEGRKELSNDN